MKESRTRDPGRRSCSSGIVIHVRYAPVVSSIPQFSRFAFFIFNHFSHLVCLLAPFPAWSSNYFHPLPFPWTDTLFPLGHRRRSTKQKHSCQKKVTTAAYAAGTQQLTSSSTLSSPPDAQSLSCQGYAREWRSCAMMAGGCGIKGLVQIYTSVRGSL